MAEHLGEEWVAAVERALAADVALREAPADRHVRADGGGLAGRHLESLPDASAGRQGGQNV